MSHEKGIEAAYERACILGDADISEYELERAFSAYLEASGMVLVPREPTDGMLGVGYKIGCNNETHEIYDVMISAAPNPFQTPEESRE